MHRAYSILDVKSVTEEPDDFVIRGMASTPQPDRVGDVVEPMGAKFKTPMPLLWQHNSREPVGLVTFAKPSKEGIPFEARLPRIKESGRLKDRIDEAIQSVKYKLVAAVSIGFNAIDGAVEALKTGGYRFTEWEWLELSLVTIPANSEATITTFKSIDQEHLRAVVGNNNAESSRPVRLFSAPGVPEKQNKALKGELIMKTKIQEHIAALEASRTAKDAQRVEIQTKALEEGRGKTEEEKTLFDQLTGEIAGIDSELKDLRSLQSTDAATTKAVTSTSPQEPAEVTTAASRVILPGQVSVGGAKLDPGIKMARYVMALKQAKGNPVSAYQIALANKTWMDTSPELAVVFKAAVAAGDTTTTGWASELVYAQNLANEFIEYLRPKTILGRVNNWRRVPFNMRVGGQSAGSTGYWVGQGASIPVSKLTTTSATLGIMKAAGIVAIDDELVRSSSPSAEALVRDDLAEAIVYLLDRSLIDPTQGGSDNVQPASLTYGLTAVTPSGTDYAAFKTDFKSLTANMITNLIDFSQSVWIMSQTTAQALSLMVTSLGVPQFPQMTPNGGTLFGYPVIVSQSAYFSSGSPDYGNMIVFLNPREVYLADDGQITISISNEASLQLLDNPTGASTGGTAAVSMVSMFQTQTEAIKAVRYIAWKKRRTDACAFIRNSLYA